MTAERARVDGLGWLALDSGALLSVVDVRRAERLGLEKESSSPVVRTRATLAPQKLELAARLSGPTPPH